MSELWKDVPGYEGIYQVSNSGIIRSLDRLTVNRNGGTPRLIPGVVMTPWDNGSGYLVVALYRGGKRKSVYVHRLVAELFLTKSDGKEYVNHLDFNTHNNRAGNLQWCTQQENISYSKDHMKKPHKGAAYVTECMDRDKLKYRVSMKGIGVDRKFCSREEAVAYRDMIIASHDYFSCIRG